MEELTSNTSGRLLTVTDAAKHYRVRPATVRAWIRAGHLDARRFGREYRLTWQELWAFEAGPAPRGERQSLYRLPLLTKSDVASRLSVSTRSVERWIGSGLPTRNALGLVRLNAADVCSWLSYRFGLDLEIGDLLVGDEA